MILIILIFVVGFGICAWSDYTTRRIPDWTTASLWLLCSIAYVFVGFEINVLVWSFALLWLLNTLKQNMGWGDILLIPVWIAAILSLTLATYGSLIISIGAASFLFVLFIYIKNINLEKLPIAVFLFLSYAIAVIIMFASGYI